MQPAPTAHDVVAALRRERPAFHAGGARDCSIDADVLAWLAANVAPSAASLETGAGASTVVFAAARARHTVVAPAGAEFDAIRAWCAAHGVATDGVAFVEATSQDALPRLSQSGPLDVVLIDGRHAFPAPLVDWTYTADRLRRGGYLLIDDTQLRPCRLLADFVRSDRERWRFERHIGRTSICRKIVDGLVSTIEWHEQPWSTESMPLLLRARRRLAALRSRLRR